MLRKILHGGVCVLGCSLGAGCHLAGPYATTGFVVAVHRPPTVVGSPQPTAVTMGNQAGLVAIDHSTLMGDMRSPVMGEARAPAPPDCGPVLPSVRRYGGRFGAATVAEQATAGSCTMDDVCRRLERIERSLAVPPTQLHAPMPRAPQE